jgi:hypothetical protein
LLIRRQRQMCIRDRSNINFQSVRAEAEGGANNKWGQSNINFQSKVIKAKGG